MGQHWNKTKKLHNVQHYRDIGQVSHRDENQPKESIETF